MAVKLLQVLVLGVIAAAADDDVPVTWVSARAALPCRIPGAERIPARRPPPPLDDDKPRAKLYAWERGGEDLKKVSNNGTLEVSRRKDAEGVYQCSARHQGGRVLGYPVNVRFAYLDKQFSVHPPNATAWRGQPYVLTCDISSGPPAAISWLRNNKPLPNNTSYIVLKNQLLIAEVADDDAGVYKCRIRNPVLNKSRTSHGGQLVVEDSPGDLELAFLPVHQDISVTAPLGSRVVLACPLVGDQKPSLVWERTPPGQRTEEQESVEENRILSNIQLDEEGVYSCRVEGNSDLVKTFNVTVTEAVSITVPPESKQAVRASTVRFSCLAAGRPAPHVRWYKDGLELQLTDRIKILPSADDKQLLQLLIRGVTSADAGIYQCFARNAVSVASAWAVLHVTGTKAAAPGALRCWPVGATDVLLMWDKVPDVLAYTVQTTMPGGASFPEQPVTDTNITIKVKAPLTPYGFQVRAYSKSPNSMKNIASDMSKIVTCQGQGVPIKLTKLDENGIFVSWQPFFEESPGVVQWMLQHKTGNDSEAQNVTLDGRIYNYTLKVSPLESVFVRVLGTRALPWTQQDLALVPWKSSADATHQLGPGGAIPVPYNVEVTDVTAHNFTVRWQCEQRARYAFLVCVSELGGVQECADTYSTSRKISHLQPDKTYEVRVQAKMLGKAIGGQFSSPVRANTLPEEELEYAHTSAGVEVSWRRAGARSVRYSQNLTQAMELWRVINVTGHTRVQITGLDPKLPTFVMVSEPGPDRRRQVLTIKPRPAPQSHLYIYIGTGCGLLALGLATAVAAVVRRRGKARARARVVGPRPRAGEQPPKQKIVGGRLANGGGSRDAGEPLLNGHVHITENPTQSKTPNGKVRKEHRYEVMAFDVARYDGDVTLETVLDASGAEPCAPRAPLSSDLSFNKLPDDNMNCEITRSTFQLDTTPLPTLQPNG